MPTRELISFDQMSPEQRLWLRYADSDYMAARVLYYVGAPNLRAIGICHEGLEKYLKLFLFVFAGVEENCEEYLRKKYLLGSNGHNLVKLREVCAVAAQGDLRASLVFSDQRFEEDIEVIQKLRYPIAARYPDGYAVEVGGAIQIFDTLIHNVRQSCLNIAETPLKIVCDAAPVGDGWPPLQRELLTTAFHHDNGKYPRAA